MHGIPIDALWQNQTSKLNSDRLRRAVSPCKNLPYTYVPPLSHDLYVVHMEEKESLLDTLRAVMKVSRGRHGGRARASVIIYGARKYFRFYGLLYGGL